MDEVDLRRRVFVYCFSFLMNMKYLLGRVMGQSVEEDGSGGPEVLERASSVT